MNASHFSFPLFGPPFLKMALVVILFANITTANGQSASPKPPKPTPAKTKWAGITASVYQIARLPNNRVSVIFIYRAAANAPDNEIYGEASPQVDGTSVVAPYSIEGQGQLIDESTGIPYAASENQVGDTIQPGQTSAMQMVRANEGFFLGGIFKCPPVNQDDPPKAQWVSFELPGLKEPIKKVLLPRGINEYVDYDRKLRLHPPAVK